MSIRTRRAFTLIELLIVVAIIAILAAIAVPNFMEAQVRAKVTRVKADLRSLKTAIETYRMDNNAYPILRLYGEMNVGQINRGGVHAILDLTTPIAYMSSVDLPDPFARGTARNAVGDLVLGNNPDWMAVPYSIGYVHIDLARKESGLPPIGSPAYLLMSLGPDYMRGPDPRTGGDWGYGSYCQDPRGTNLYEAWQYDPTNGTQSRGDILMWP